MTDLAAALANVDLGDFEGSDVLSVGIEIPSAAGGLRDAVKIDPVVLHKDDEVMVLLRCKVGKIRHDPVKDTQGVQRIHILTTEEATIVDGDVFTEALTVQRERIQRAKDEAAGQGRLPTDEELAYQHGEGAHSEGLVEGCPECDAEVAKTAEENA